MSKDDKKLESHRAVAHRLLGAVRTIQLHGSANSAATSAIERLHAAMISIAPGATGGVTFQFVDQLLLVNEVRISLSVATDQNLAPLYELFQTRRVGGIRVFAGVEPIALRDWLTLFSQSVHDEDEAAMLRNALARMSANGIEVLEQKTIASTEHQHTVDVTSMSYALQTYARAVVGFKELVVALQTGRDPFSGRINVVRVVRDLIEVANTRPDLLLRILQLRIDNQAAIDAGYAEVHAANTAIYAILIGKLLNFDRVAILDLGTSALLADVGFAILPEELTEKRGTLSPEQRRELKRFMRRAVQTMIGRGRVNDAMLRRVIVAYEHHYPFVHPTSKTRTLTHIYSRIVAVADAFDALTSQRTWRDPMTKDAALETLALEAGSRYDPMVVAALGSLIRARAQLHPEQAVC